MIEKLKDHRSVWRIIAVISLILIVGISWYLNHQRSSAMTHFDIVQVTAVEQDFSKISKGEVSDFDSKGEPFSLADSQIARIQVGLRDISVSHNRLGEFPRLQVPMNSEITAQVIFPEAKLGEIINVQAEDGGQLGEDTLRGVSTGQEGQVSIQFKTSAHEGLHRVTLRHGASFRVLQFWVGPEPPVVVRDEPYIKN